MVAVVINADDFGLSDGVCRSILQLLERSAISNTTILAASEGAAERCRRYGVSAIANRAGAHLQLTGGRPLSPPIEVPSLIDRRTGLFLGKGDLHRMSPEEVELEWTRQIEHVATLLGRRPSHLDSHHGVHRFPNLMPVYFRLARRFELPIRGEVFAGQFADQAQDVCSSTLVLCKWTGRGLSAQHLKDVVITTRQRLQDGDVLEIVVHPGFSDPELESISSLNRARLNDHQVLLQLADEAWFSSQGMPVVRYPSLQVAPPADPQGTL
jgi:predicted glycoside hydrolase/deacetylase ChbG (UPF0249 family)